MISKAKSAIIRLVPSGLRPRVKPIYLLAKKTAIRVYLLGNRGNRYFVGKVQSYKTKTKIKFTALKIILRLQKQTNCAIGFGIRGKILDVLATFQFDQLYDPYLSYNKEQGRLCVNVKIGGKPQQLQKNYIDRGRAAKVLRDRHAKEIFFIYEDYWELLPPPPFAQECDCAELIPFASTHPEKFFDFFRIPKKLE